MEGEAVPRDILVDLEEAEISNVREVLFDTTRTLPQALRNTWQGMGNSVAMTHGYTGRQLRFSELLEAVNRLANAFHAEGLRQGQAILVLAHSSLEVYMALFAAWFIGCVTVLASSSWSFAYPFPHSITPKSKLDGEGTISKVLERCKMEFVIADGTSISLVTKLADLTHANFKRIFYTDDPLSIPMMLQSCSGEQLTDIGFPVECHPEDVLFVAFTSATTGEPKPVPVTHFSFLAMTAVSLDCGLYGTDKHLLVWAPPHHIAGITVTTASMLCGARIVVVPERTAHMDPHQIAFICENHKVNCLIGCSDFISGLLQRNLRHCFEGISSVVTTGYSPEQGRLREMREFFSLREEVKIAYGTTETIGPVLISSQAESPPMKAVPLPHFKVRVVNSRNEPVAPGFEGEILIKGTFVASAYWSGTSREGDEPHDDVCQWNNDNFTSDGWFRTGDLGLYNEYGHVTVIGQMQDVIPLDKHRIHCSLLEEFFLEHEAVREVKVVAVPRENGLEVIACIVPDPGTPDAVLLADLYDAIDSSAFPVNRVHRVFLFDDLPRTAWRRPSRRILISQLRTTSL
ncbi:uncharacterized protein LOC100909017 [Galendromus occidentalis]|uniref:Uncharacterized protein LOC100909017 n=1 Tax=Galendromus occidentalis TaxID=34638 RepID=A0AAJ6QS64_9ACAR|nr:uncharacterized protein LOC100909017 [Galendromus occidentalis]